MKSRHNMESFIADLLPRLVNLIPTIRKKQLSQGLLSEAFNELERENSRADYLLMHRSIKPLLSSWGWGTDAWGTSILYADEIEESTGYALSETGTSVCFTWDATPEPVPPTQEEPPLPPLPTQEEPPLQKPLASCCPHCGKRILVALLKEEKAEGDLI